jgi:Cu(I)-responsive transcriptional regulator
MNIGHASKISGLPAKTIRYYEEIGLVIADRRDNGYRDYSDTHLHKLKFLRRARRLGFRVDECRNLLSLYEDSERSSADVRELANAKVEEIETKIAELESLKETLSSLVKACHGDERPDCPILNDLAGER